MPLHTQGRRPGPLGTTGQTQDGSTRPYHGPSLRVSGPLGRGVSQALLAQRRSPLPAMPQPTPPTVTLVEPEPVCGCTPPELREVAVPLFGGPGPSPAEVIQGQVANCPLGAVLVAMAHARPQMLRDMLTEHRAAVCSRRRADTMPRWWTDCLYNVQFHGHASVRLSSLLYHSADGQLVYARTPNGVGWVSYIEKAYAIFRGGNSYHGLNDTTQLHQPPSAQQIMDDLVGPYDVIDLVHDRLFSHAGQSRALTPAHLQQVLAQTGRSPTIAVSLRTAVPVPGLVVHHGYGVLDFVSTGNTVRLRNPYGGPNADVRLALEDFRRAFQAILQATSAGP